MRIWLAALALSLLFSRLAIGQLASSEITNADVISMARAGIGDQTIILAIQRGPVKFDTSPQALIALKSAGVSDQVLNAILASVNSKGQASSDAQSFDARALFQKAVDAIGPHDKLAAIHSIRWVGADLQGAQGGNRTFEREVVIIYPDKQYTSLKSATGQFQMQVVTPDFNYRNAGGMTVAVPPADLEIIRGQFQFDTVYVAQHAENYTVSPAGEEQVGDIAAEKLKIARAGREVTWEIDPKTGRILTFQGRLPDA